MTMKLAIYALALSAAAVAPGMSQTTDPKATDMNGNGPPAFIMSQDKKDSSSEGQTSPTKDDKKRAAAERPVSGFVTDADGKPVVGAVVQLKNTRTLQVRSYITRDKGDYFFAGLNKDVDYEVKAQFQGHASPTRTLSSFDTKPQPVINLQIK